jgi:hypothetical protein
MTLHIAQQQIRAITAERFLLAVVSLMDTDVIGIPAAGCGQLHMLECPGVLPSGGKHNQV